MIEAFVFLALLGMALLWHAASSLGGYKLMRSQASHGTALQTSRHFIERLRTDPEWETLYARLCDNLDTPAPPHGHALETYYADLTPPAELGEVGILIEVPRAAAVDSLPADPLVLREDIAAARFGLPHDLNGDGRVDSESHSDDYRGLPIIVHFNWHAPSESPQSLKIATYLRGLR